MPSNELHELNGQLALVTGATSGQTSFRSELKNPARSMAGLGSGAAAGWGAGAGAGLGAGAVVVTTPGLLRVPVVVLFPPGLRATWLTMASRVDRS